MQVPTKASSAGTSTSARWEHLSDAITDVWSILCDPRNPSIMYAGTRPAALYRSTDGGITWSELTALGLAKFSNVNMGPDPGHADALRSVRVRHSVGHGRDRRHLSQRRSRVALAPAGGTASCLRTFTASPSHAPRLAPLAFSPRRIAAFTSATTTEIAGDSRRSIRRGSTPARSSRDRRSFNRLSRKRQWPARQRWSTAAQPRRRRHLGNVDAARHRQQHRVVYCRSPFESAASLRVHESRTTVPQHGRG